MIKIISVITGLVLLGLCLVAFTILLWFLASKLADFILRRIARKYRLDKVDTDRVWWYELTDDRLHIGKQMVRWYYRWYINPDGIYAVSKSGDLLACWEAINGCLYLIHQMYALENEISWRKFHYGECYLDSADEWAKGIIRDRKRLEHHLKDLKEKEALILARMTEDAAKGLPIDEDEYYILR